MSDTNDSSTDQEEKEEKGQSLIAHLIELRDRMLRMVLAVLLIFFSLFYWANQIYTMLAEPLTRHLPDGQQMIAIDVASPFLTPFKLVLVLSVILAMPFILYQLWAFVAPGLYKNEKRLAVPLLISSVLLFYLGIFFAYMVVFPLVFGFFTSIGPEIISVQTDIDRYLTFVIKLFFGFGLAFEVPVATIIVIAMGLTTAEKLAQKRPYVIVAAFIIGMLLTPPDIISQVLLAFPMWLLFEFGLVMSKVLLKKASEDADEDEDDETVKERPNRSRRSEEKAETKAESKNEAEEMELRDPGATSTGTTSGAGGSAFVGRYDVLEDDDPHAEYGEDDDALSEEEMEAELDRIEAEEEASEAESENQQEEGTDSHNDSAPEAQQPAAEDAGADDADNDKGPSPEPKSP